MTLLVCSAGFSFLFLVVFGSLITALAIFVYFAEEHFQ